MKKSNLTTLFICMVLFCLICSNTVYAATIEVSPAHKITDNGNIAGDGYYERDPSFLISTDGTWYISYSKSQTNFTHNSNPDSLYYDIYVKSSADNGTTWSAETKVLDASAINAASNFRNSIIIEADGKIWVIGADVRGLEGNIYANTLDGTWSGQEMIFDGTYNTGAFHLDAIVEGNDIRLFYGIQNEANGIGFIKYHGDDDTWDSSVTLTGVSGQIPRVSKVGDTYHIVTTDWSNILYTKTATPDTVPWPAQTAISAAPPSGYACDPDILSYDESGFIVFNSPSYLDNSQPVEYVYSINNGSSWNLTVPFTKAISGTNASWDMMPNAYLKDTNSIMLFYGMEQRGVNRGQGDIVYSDFPISAIGNKHYTAIQNGIDNATIGDTINVSAGTYDGDLWIHKSLTLQGAGYDTTIIRGVPGGSTLPLCTIDAGGATPITINGFTITQTITNPDPANNANNVGVLFQGIATTTLTNCSIQNHYTGVFLSSISNGTVEHNIIKDNGNGVLMQGCESPSCTPSSRFDNTTIRYNNFTGNGLGTSSSRAAVRITGPILGTGPLVNYNSFVGNININSGSAGAFHNMGEHFGTATNIDSANNWWGSSTGPMHSSNLGGMGDNVSNNVTFMPYYINGEMTILSNVNKSISAFNIPNQQGVTTIDEDAYTIVLTMPYGTDISSLAPIINFTGGSVNPASLVPINFTNPVNYTVTSFDGTATQDYVATVTVNNSVTLNSTTPEVVITDITQNVTVIIEEGATNVSIDVSSLVSNSTVNGTDVVTGAIPQIIIDSPVANVVIPATNVSCSDTSWDGVIDAPTITTTVVPNTATETMTTSMAIEIGFADAKLSFDNAVRILLPGQVGKRVGYSRTGLSFTEITDICDGDNQTMGDALVADGDCKIDVGDDLVIWTKHFTKFATFSSTLISTSTASTRFVSGGAIIDDDLQSPSELFDIKFELDFSTLENSNELSSVIIFVSFGTVPTFVDLTYNIFDLSEVEVYSEKGNVTVTTEQIVRKDFENLELPDGKYILILTTVYGDNITDEFRQDFEVKKKTDNISIDQFYLFSGVILIAIILFYIKRNKVKMRKKAHRR